MNTITKPMLALCLLVANPILANLTTLDKPAGFQAHIYPTVANSPLLRCFFWLNRSVQRGWTHCLG